VKRYDANKIKNEKQPVSHQSSVLVLGALHRNEGVCEVVLLPAVGNEAPPLAG
jgi:hypothetical protein